MINSEITSRIIALSRNRWSLEEHEQEQGDNRQNICRNGEQERLYFDLSGALIFFFAQIMNLYPLTITRFLQ